MKRVTLGLEKLIENPSKYLYGSTIGLVVNQTSLTSNGEFSIDKFYNNKSFKLKTLLAPEHGVYGVDQDMALVENETDPLTGLTIQSLYGSDASSLTPSPTLLNGIDNLIFDIQDVGSRYYTFIYTLANCMKTCAQSNTRMVVCDRPNPINGLEVEGNIVKKDFYSFVGQYPIPNRHGMTVGELALLFNEHFGIKCDLKVIPMEGWERQMWYDETGLPWVAPSPNMPTLSTATVYPGMCLVEGTLLSEGRGTTLPFEQVGAPYINAETLAKILNKENLPGLFFRPQYFKPQFQKWSGELCGGVQIHITERKKIKPLLTSISMLFCIKKLYPNNFLWRTEAYEFVSDRLAIDLLYGDPTLRKAIDTGTLSLNNLESIWAEDIKHFSSQREACLIY
jgi:uncharacterized protein YbbC (DUF1343 family)